MPYHDSSRLSDKAKYTLQFYVKADRSGPLVPAVGREPVYLLRTVAGNRRLRRRERRVEPAPCRIFKGWRLLSMDETLERRTIAKVTWRLIPFLMVCYFVSFLDRVNLGFAGAAISKHFAFSATVFGLGAGIFFIGYFLFEVPSNVILHRVGASRWIARIMVSWGIVSALMALVSGPMSFYVLRFLLGVAEAGFFPGIILYLTYWFPAEYRGRFLGAFAVAVPVSTVIGAPISGLLLGLDGVMGL
ncbi:MAG TPA: MFS transporter, partial [Aliidongia sp.]|nr:MFS transporter [Aliidongia sp.]